MRQYLEHAWVRCQLGASVPFGMLSLPLPLPLPKAGARGRFLLCKVIVAKKERNPSHHMACTHETKHLVCLTAPTPDKKRLMEITAISAEPNISRCRSGSYCITNQSESERINTMIQSHRHLHHVRASRTPRARPQGPENLHHLFGCHQQRISLTISSHKSPAPQSPHCSPT